MAVVEELETRGAHSFENTHQARDMAERHERVDIVPELRKAAMDEWRREDGHDDDASANVFTNGQVAFYMDHTWSVEVHTTPRSCRWQH